MKFKTQTQIQSAVTLNCIFAFLQNLFFILSHAYSVSCFYAGGLLLLEEEKHR